MIEVAAVLLALSATSGFVRVKSSAGDLAEVVVGEQFVVDSRTSALKSVDETPAVHEQWYRYLHLELPAHVSAPHVEAVRRVWRELDAAVERLPPPISIVTARETVQLAWSTEAAYFEVEVHEDGRFEWFFRDRRCGEYAGTEDEPVSELTSDIVDRLRRVRLDA